MAEDHGSVLIGKGMGLVRFRRVGLCVELEAKDLRYVVVRGLFGKTLAELLEKYKKEGRSRAK